MARFIQYDLLPYTDISQTIFFGGTGIEGATATGFETSFLNLTLVFEGTELTYDANGDLTGGTVEGFRMYDGAIQISNQMLIAEFDLAATDLATAFALFENGDVSNASDMILNDWLAEHFWHTNYAGGPLRGYGGEQSLYGGSNIDIVNGYGGDDAILLYGNDDVGLGGAGNDRIWGGLGNDLVAGQDDNDILRGEEGNDTVLGGSGSDQMYGGLGDDTMRGGAGDDYITGDVGFDVLVGGNGNDTIVSGPGFEDEALIGGAGDDVLTGHNGDNRLVGGSGDDSMIGGQGNDLLIGHIGADTLRGNAGEDTLIGGGEARMAGGSDADTFVLRNSDGSRQTILDFEDDVDTLNLQLFSFADAAAVEAAATETATGHVLFDLGDWQVLLVLHTTYADLADDIIF